MLKEARCPKCHTLLGYFFGAAEIKCRKGCAIYNIGLVPLSTGFEIKIIECLRAPDLNGAQNVIQ